MERISIIDFIKLDFSYHNSEEQLTILNFMKTHPEIYENGLNL